MIRSIPKRLRDHPTPTAPSDRLCAANGLPQGYFFPGEVARVLAIDVIDYRQLRRFYKLIRAQSDHSVPEGWSRYTFTDIAALVVALEICGGLEALQPGSRLVLADLHKVCQRLVEQGIWNPLLRVGIGRRGRSLTITLDGMITEPDSGQLLMESMATKVDLYFDDTLLRDRELAQSLRSEIARFRDRT